MICSKCKVEKGAWEFTYDHSRNRVRQPCKECKKVYDANKPSSKERRVGNGPKFSKKPFTYGKG